MFNAIMFEDCTIYWSLPRFTYKQTKHKQTKTNIHIHIHIHIQNTH